MKRLLIALALALGLVVTLAGNPMNSPAYATNDTQGQFASNNFTPAPVAIDTGPSVSIDNTAIATAAYIDTSPSAGDNESLLADKNVRPFDKDTALKIANDATAATARAPSQPDHPAVCSLGERTTKT